MSTTLYNNACAPAQAKAKVNPAMTNRSPENRLVLLPEHSTIVYKHCLEKLALCQLSLRYSRVFYIVLNQTVGESKREDNINSMRLEKLTKLRHDHAAQAMKDLVAMNVIIHRTGGKYRNWLSINFNVEMWGNSSIAEQHKSNNPELLLPKKYTETPVDNGLLLDPNKLQNIPPTCTETASPNSLESTEKTENYQSLEIENNIEKQIESTANNSQNSEKSVESSRIDKQAVQKLETKLTTLFSKKLSSALETINQTLQGFEKHLSTQESNTTANTASSTTQSIESKPVQNNQETQELVVVASKKNYKVEIAPFNYPEELDTEQCQALQGLLVKSGDRAQDLLTLLAQRLKNTHNPVVDPASYFASLVYKYQKNKLDFSGLSAIKTPKSKQEKAHKKHIDELKFNHHICHNDYLHFQNLIEIEMKKSQQSFKQVCENNPLGSIIENCAHKLQQAKTALDDFLAGDTLIPA